MRNIFILPTNKPSRLYAYKSIELYLNPVIVDATSSNTNCKNQNMYITSDEKIKQGDWYIYDNRIWKMRYPKWRKEGQLEAKKIVLTTDPDLIKDAIQAIDNEFLEWFVQNLSCEKVEVVEDYRKCCRNIDGANENCIEAINCEGWLNNEYEKPYKTDCEKRFEGYKIIIPKEEPIHTSYTGKVWEPSKQETVKEAAEKYWSRQPYNEDPFVEGVKWQQERSYSREEVLFQLNLLYSMKSSTLDTFTNEKDMITMNWFKQFKEK